MKFLPALANLTALAGAQMNSSNTINAINAINLTNNFVNVSSSYNYNSTTTQATTGTDAVVAEALLDTLSDSGEAFGEFIANVTSAAYDFTTQLFTAYNDSALSTLTTPTTTTTTTTTTAAYTTTLQSVSNNLDVATLSNYTSTVSEAGVDHWPSNVTPHQSSTNIVHDLASTGGVNGAVGGAALAPGATAIDYYNGDDDDDFELAPCHPDNPDFNCTRDEYVKFFLGPQTLPLYKVLLVTIIFGGIFITGVLGNVLVCVVIVRHPTMHTATNYYLFSLAVSDLLYLLFGLPAEIFLYWHQYPYLFGLPFCKIRAFISEASTYVSVLTIVAFSMERFLAICHPLHLYAMSGFKRALRIIGALWIVSFISAIPFGLMTDIQYVNYPLTDAKILESAFCAMVHFPDNFPLFELSFCVFFIIPMILIIILYGRMGAQIRFSTTQQLGVQQGSMHRESRHQQSRKAVIRMLAAVVITFFVCWLPFHMQRLWFLYAKNYKNFQEINEWMFSITGFTYYVSCTINPILYNVMSHRYRVAFKDILWGKRRSVYYNNGFARDQSSFRETTVASSLCGPGGGGLGNNSAYDRVHSVRVRSMRHMNNIKDRDSIKSHNPLWMKKSTEFTPPKEVPESPPKLSTNVVVVVDNGGINGRPKVYTENEAEQTLLNKDNETCI